MLTTLTELFARHFDRQDVTEWARLTGALERLRQIQPLELCLSLVGSAIGDEERSIATARRLYDRLTGFMPEESTFYDRFNSGLARLLRHLFEQAWETCPRQRREAIATLLHGKHLCDLLAMDATQVTLPASARGRFPSTSPDHGGFKLTTVLSVLHQRLESVKVTAAKVHDRKAVKLARWLRGQLWLMDRGYSDHGLFQTIARRGGFFLTRLKTSSKPTITCIRSGLGQAHVGRRLDRDLPYRGTVDLDCAFRLRSGGTYTCRVVRIVVEQPHGRDRTESVDLWLVTNLSDEDFSPDELALLYRLRWEIESLFHVLKQVGRLDQLRSANRYVIHAFLYATLLGLVLALDVCARMREARPWTEPSVHRTATVLLGYLPLLAAAVGTDRFSQLLVALEAALWREGVNPNPGRPYRATAYVNKILHENA